jgi:hypothetical protein
MSWFAAHLIMYVKPKERPQTKFTVWENIVLIRADSEDEAFTKAEQRGRDDEGDEDGSLLWGGRPASWVFAGVRKLTLCQDSEKRPGDGTEVTYTEMQLDSEKAVRKLVEGHPVAIRYREQFGVKNEG